jgi:hypothetical protein
MHSSMLGWGGFWFGVQTINRLTLRRNTQGFLSLPIIKTLLMSGKLVA